MLRLSGLTSILRQTNRSVLGHKLEIILGKHKTENRLIPPPKFPAHPLVDTDKNMDELTSYQDLKLRWSSKQLHTRKKMNIARHWKNPGAHYPSPAPKVVCVHHWQPPQPLSNNYAGLKALDRLENTVPPENQLEDPESKQIFAVFKPDFIRQLKVSVGDLVQTERLRYRQAGDSLVFGTVLCAGTRHWTLIGKPTIPYVKVHCTIEQMTLARETIVYQKRAKRRNYYFRRCRQWVAIMRVDRIEVDYEAAQKAVQAGSPEKGPNWSAAYDPPAEKPLRLLDLWANRVLTPQELEGIPMDEDGRPQAEKICAHVPPSLLYHRQPVIRTYPDPQSPFRPAEYLPRKLRF